MMKQLVMILLLQPVKDYFVFFIVQNMMKNWTSCVFIYFVRKLPQVILLLCRWCFHPPLLSFIHIAYFTRYKFGKAVLIFSQSFVENMLLPIAMEEAPAPDNLLKIVRCACKRYFKHGLKCTEICVECCGVSCLKVQEKILEHDDEE